MIGQKKLLETFNNFTIHTLPHSILLIGKYGCGKKSLSKSVADRLNLTYYEVCDKINYDVVDNISHLINSTLCVIDNNNISEKEESALLKLIEEPPTNVFIMILSETSSNVMPTIYNRCQVFTFETYTKDELSNFCSSIQSPLLLDIADTPGKVIKYNSLPIDSMNVLIDTIFDKISIANIANILTITDKIDFSGNEKFPINVFSDVLIDNITKRVVNNVDKSTDQYAITRKYYNNLVIPNINKKQLFEHFLYELKEVK